eukprot:gene10757-13166_t
MPLPLVARKSIRDNEEYLREAQETIKNAIGVEWTFELDFEDILSKLSEDYRDRIGELFYKEVCKNIASCVEKASKDETTKEALVESNQNSKVIIRPLVMDKKNNDYKYWNYLFENGSLVVVFKTPLCNISDLSYFKIEAVIPTPGVYSLTARLNLKENKEKFDTALETIKDVMGCDWTYDEASLETVYQALDKDLKERIGDLFSEVMGYVAQNIKNRCKDDMVLEAFREATPNSKVTFKQDGKQSSYWVWKFEDGGVTRGEQEQAHSSTGPTTMWATTGSSSTTGTPSTPAPTTPATQKPHHNGGSKDPCGVGKDTDYEYEYTYEYSTLNLGLNLDADVNSLLNLDINAHANANIAGNTIDVKAKARVESH